MTKTTLKTGTRKTTITRIAVREVIKGQSISTSSPSEKPRKAPGHRTGSILLLSTTKPESQMTSFEKMEATRKGISKKELEELKKRAGLDYNQLSHILQVARATLIAKKGTERFPVMLSEKIMSVADIYS